MSRQPTKAAPKATSPKPREAFAAGSFGNLRAAIGEGQGEALGLLLADIDEDPDQPRTVFDEDELESLAESIRLHGVVQPVVVRPAVNGRYRLAFGARRFRASKLAGVIDIPAVIRAGGSGDFAAQVIENQQRADLSNSDLAAAIERLVRDGSSNKEIGAICALKDYLVPAFRQVGNFPAELRARLDNGDIRALYDLFRQWSKTPAAVIDALPDADTFITVTEARRIIGAITGKPTGSIVLDRQASGVPEAASDPVAGLHGANALAISAAPLAVPEQASEPASGLHGANSLAVPAVPLAAPEQASEPAAGLHGANSRQVTAAPVTDIPAPSGAPVLIVRLGDGEAGRLVMDRRAERDGALLVAYATGIEEVDATALRIVGVE